MSENRAEAIVRELTEAQRHEDQEREATRKKFLAEEKDKAERRESYRKMQVLWGEWKESFENHELDAAKASGVVAFLAELARLLEHIQPGTVSVLASKPKRFEIPEHAAFVQLLSLVHEGDGAAVERSLADASPRIRLSKASQLADELVTIHHIHPAPAITIQPRDARALPGRSSTKLYDYKTREELAFAEWLYKNKLEEKKFDVMISELEKISESKGWPDKISRDLYRETVATYCHRTGATKPPKNKGGRPPKSKPATKN